MDLKYLDELNAVNTPHKCHPPGWWGRLRLGIGRNGTWVCDCGTIWRWRYWGYSDMSEWEQVPRVEPGVHKEPQPCGHDSDVAHHYYADLDGRGVRKLWCAGPVSLLLEPWRAQLEFQMNAHPIGLVEHTRETSDVPQCGPDYGLWQIHGETTGRFSTQHPPLTQTRRGSTPIYDSVVTYLGFDPRMPRDIAGSSITLPMRWREVWADLSS